jgi:hypothetical protein
VTTTVELALALATGVGGIGHPIGRWITELATTRRQREALGTLERLAAQHPDAAHLVAEAVRAGQANAGSRDRAASRRSI